MKLLYSDDRVVVSRMRSVQRWEKRTPVFTGYTGWTG